MQVLTGKDSLFFCGKATD